jgi:mannosyl-oligosaccharide alpha-1,3-glucosidase
MSDKRFKTSSESGFCRRGRALASRAKAAGTSWKSPYSVHTGTVSIDSQRSVLSARVKSSLYPDIKFQLEVRVHEDGVVRVRVDEVDGLRKRYDEAASWALVKEPEISKEIQWKLAEKDARAVYGPGKDIELVVAFEPLKVILFRRGEEQIVLNGRGLFHMEHFRSKKESPPETTQGGEQATSQKVLKTNDRAWFEGEEEDAWWEETWSSWTDSKPKGDKSLS